MRKLAILLLVAALPTAAQLFQPSPTPVNQPNWWNVKAFGASGAGVSSDYEPIRQAIQSAINNGGGVVYFPPGTYKLGTNLSVTDSTVCLRFDKGASIAPSTGITLTVTSCVVADSGSGCITTGGGTCSVYGGTGTYNVKAYGAIGSGSGDDRAAIQLAIDAAAAAGGGTVYFPAGNYRITTSELTVSTANVHLVGEGSTASKITQATGGQGAIAITASNVSVSRLALVGPQYAAQVSGESAITALGTNDTTRITDISVEDCTINSWGYEGVYFSFVDRAYARRNRVYNVQYSGIQGRNANYAIFSDNVITNITNATLSVALSLNGTVSQATASKYGTITGNEVTTCAFEGILTEPSEFTVVSGNTVTDCYLPIVIGSHPTGGISKHVTVSDNIVTNVSLSTMASRKAGIIVGGESIGTQSYDVAVTGNTVRGYGTNSGATYGAIHLYYTDGATVVGNNVYSSYVAGIYLYAGVTNSSVTGNNVVGFASATGASAGILATASADKDDGTVIAQNNIRTLAVDANCIALQSNDALLWIGQNFCETGNAVDILTVGYKRNQTLYRDSTVASHTGAATEATLMSIVIPANSMTRYSGIRVSAWGDKTGAAGNKTVTLYWGSASYVFNAAANDTNTWRVEAEIIANAATNAQVLYWKGWNGTTMLSGSASPTQDTTSDVTLKITGTLADGADTVTQRGFIVERF